MPGKKARATLAITSRDALMEIGETRKMISNLQGVQKAEVNLITDKLYVEYDPAVITLEKIKKTIERNGN